MTSAAERLRLRDEFILRVGRARARSQRLELSPPRNDEELWSFVRDVWRVEIPRLVHPDCEGHHLAPFTAFADAYYCRTPTAVWVGSRGLGGKTFLLALLVATEAATLGAEVSLLGGSEEQARIAYEYVGELWALPSAPAGLLRQAPTRSELRLTNGGGVFVHRASSRSARGQHRPRLRVDEADEFRLSRSDRNRIEVLDDALGQPMSQGDVAPQTLIASTWHHHDGAMSLLQRRLRSEELDGALYEWCYKESLRRVVDGELVGWLPEADIEAMRGRMTRQQFEVEVALQEPHADDLAIAREAVDAMWDSQLNEFCRGGTSDAPFQGAQGEYIELPCCREYDPAEGPHRFHRYATGCDWGRKRDFTAIVTYRTDLDDGRWWLVGWQIDRGLPWPELTELLNERLRRFPGQAAFDATGIGDALSSMIAGRAWPVVMTGGPTGRRARLFNDYIVAIEDGRLLGPRIERAWEDHRALTRQDLFGSGGHAADSFVAGSLGACRSSASRLDLDLGVDRLTSNRGPAD